MLKNINDGPYEKYGFDPRIVNEILTLEYDPNASYFYHDFSGGFLWEDEFNTLILCYSPMLYHINFVLAYRSSLILGEECEAYRHIWEVWKELFPDWPGFRPERCSPSLRKELIEEQNPITDEMKELEERIEKINSSFEIHNGEPWNNKIVLNDDIGTLLYLIEKRPLTTDEIMHSLINYVDVKRMFNLEDDSEVDDEIETLHKQKHWENIPDELYLLCKRRASYLLEYSKKNDYLIFDEQDGKWILSEKSKEIRKVTSESIKKEIQEQIDFTYKSGDE